MDILGNDTAISNLDFTWSHGQIEGGITGTVLKNNLTNQTIVFTDLNRAAETIKLYGPNSVVVCNFFLTFV